MVILAAMALSLGATAATATTLQYFPTSPNPGSTYLTWTWKSAAVRFTVPSDSAYRIDSLDMCIYGNQDRTSLDVVVWADNAGSRGDVVYLLNDVAWHDVWNSFDLSGGGLVLPAGASFFAGYDSNASQYSDAGFVYRADSNHGNSFALRLEDSSWTALGGDLAFRAYVTPVPEPSSIIAVLGGLAGLIGLRRRK